jgi:hypothetical protein
MFGPWRYFLGFVLVIAVTTVVAYWTDPWPESLPSGPQEIEEVIAVTRNLGLHYRSDRLDGVIDGRLIVSELPLTWERAARLSACRMPEHPDWIGTVAVYRTTVGSPTFDGYTDRSVTWGSFLLYGDPSLIERLTGRTSTASRK